MKFNPQLKTTTTRKERGNCKILSGSTGNGNYSTTNTNSIFGLDMPKYKTTSEQQQLNSDKVRGKEYSDEPRFNEHAIVIIDIKPSTPHRHEFIYQNGRIVGIRTDEYNTRDEEWEKCGVSTPNELPERVLIELETHTGKQTWINEIDIERCENFTRTEPTIEYRD